MKKCLSSDSRDRIVSTSRCGRDNPGSNPGHGKSCECRRHGTAGHIVFPFYSLLTIIVVSSILQTLAKLNILCRYINKTVD